MHLLLTHESEILLNRAQLMEARHAKSTVRITLECLKLLWPWLDRRCHYHGDTRGRIKIMTAASTQPNISSKQKCTGSSFIIIIIIIISSPSLNMAVLTGLSPCD
jgi:hypothetical protein